MPSEINSKINPFDFLNFIDTKKYYDRIKEAQSKTGLKDAIRVAYGKSCGKEIVIACMDFKFIGGSMGSVVGEKIVRAIDYSIKKKAPLLIISNVTFISDIPPSFIDTSGSPFLIFTGLLYL